MLRMTTPFELRTRSTVIFGDGALSRIGTLAKDLGFTRALLAAHTGVVSAGLSDCAAHALQDAGVGVVLFSEFHSNPDTEMVEAGAHFAAAERIDSIVGLGGGSSMDCAKGINFVLTQGGRMADYRG